MKFGIEYRRRMVSEWVDAYMDYDGLKRILHEIGVSQAENRDRQGGEDIEGQVIKASSSARSHSRNFFWTNLFPSSEDTFGKAEVNFFKKLDEELNKVNAFYKDKVEGVLNDVAELNKQIDAYSALRINMQNHAMKGSDSVADMEPLRVRARNGDNCQEGSCVNNSRSCRGNMDLTKDTSNSNLVQTLERGKIRNEAGSPTSAIRRISRAGLNDEERSLSKEELKEVADQLKVALTEFYRKLRLLKSFSFTNLSAFANIMKKYDKITLRHAARSYMKIVDKSYLGSSNEITELMNSTENLFAKHFNGKRIKGMKPSRQGRRRERNGVTFFSGLFSGCSIALVVAIILMVRATKIMENGQGTSNMDNMFGLYSLFLFIVLHMLMYAGDLYFWERYQVNYRFIFNFKKRTALNYHELFLLSTGLAVLALASFLANLNMLFGLKMEVPMNFSKSMPIIVASVFVAIVFLPFNIIYHTSRFSLIKRLFRCICAPFYKVTLADFFFADQLTSQIQALRSIEFYICYYSHKGIPQGQSNCHDYKLYNIFYSVLPIVPYWFISLQCLRRLVQERDRIHGYNALKYLVAVIAIVIRTVYELRKGTLWLVLALISSALAVAYNAYWDIVVDWGLLRLKSNKLYLRDKRLVSHRSVYLVAMVINVLLRVAWLQLVLAFDIHGFRKTAISILIYCLEIIRRGIWNFFRLENEHLNNVGKFRAFTSVPLTSNHHNRSNDDDDDDDDDDETDD